MEERGQVKKIVPQSFYLLFKSTPVCLLALNQRNAEYIQFLKCDYFVDLDAHLDENNIKKSLCHSAILSLGRKRSIFNSPPDDIIYLVSGSLPFLNENSILIMKKRYFCHILPC